MNEDLIGQAYFDAHPDAETPPAINQRHLIPSYMEEGIQKYGLSVGGKAIHIETQEIFIIQEIGVGVNLAGGIWGMTLEFTDGTCLDEDSFEWYRFE